MAKRVLSCLLTICLLTVWQPIAQAGSDSGLSRGSRGDEVRKLQTALSSLGYYTESVDGLYGSGTAEAVAAFQRAEGLKPDGIAGKEVLTALDDAFANIKNGNARIFLNRIAAESGAACGVFVLSRNGNNIFTYSFGGVTEYTCFRIASITKWVTAIGLMTLYDQGRLDLDRDISEYLPFRVRNPAWPRTALTARMLLSHTSSLSPDANIYHPKWSRIGIGGYDPIFDESAEPGTKYAYADYNGALFGCLIEAITGESVQNYMNRTVFTPLGITAAYTPKMLPAGTDTKDLLDKKGRVAISVRKDLNRAFNNRADPAGNNGYTVGKLYIDAASLTRMAQMMLNGGELDGIRILKAETVALMESDQPGLADSPYGLGTVRHTQFSRGTWYGHQGRYSGLSSNIFYQRETGLTMALIMNGYAWKLSDNIVLPAFQILENMKQLESCLEEGASDCSNTGRQAGGAE